MRHMSEKTIPEHIDPYRYAEQNLAIDGVLAVNTMSRLLPNLHEDATLAEVHVHFGRDEQGTTYLKGQIKADLVLQCQRCMEAYQYPIVSDLALGIVTNLDEANALPDFYEPVMVHDKQLALHELVEDELILNLPIIPKHAVEECQVSLPSEDEAQQKVVVKNPFHVLQSLKENK